LSAQYRINFNKHGEGWVVNERAGENLGLHKLVYRNAAGTWSLADADTVARMPVLGITMGAISNGMKGEILLWGYIGTPIDPTLPDIWSWTAGGEIYASTVAGELTQVEPTGIGDVVQVVAVAIEATLIHFMGNVAGKQGKPWDKVTEASYIIFTDGTTYYAKNGVTGQIDFSGIVASTVIQSTINQIGVLGGGNIFLKKGTYTCSTTLNIANRDRITLLGEEGTIIRCTVTIDPLLHIATSTNITINGLTFQGTGAGSAMVLILVDGTIGTTTKNIRILSVNLLDSEAGIRIADYVMDVEIDNIIAESTIWTIGSLISPNSSHVVISNVVDTYTNGWAVSLDRGLQYATIENIIGVGKGSVALASVKHITVNNCISLDSENKYGFNIETTPGELTTEDVSFNNCLAYSGSTQPGFTINGALNVTLANCQSVEMNDGFYIVEGNIDIFFINCQAIKNQKNGYVSNTLTGPTFVGLSFINCLAKNNSQSAANTFYGFAISDGADLFIQCCRMIDDQGGGATQRAGIWLAGTVTSGRIFDNYFKGNISAPILGVAGIVNMTFRSLPIYVKDPDTNIGTHPAVLLPDGVNTSIYDQIQFPLEFQYLIAANIIIVPSGTGDIRRSAAANWGKIGIDNYNTDTDTIAAGQVAVTQNKLEAIDISPLFTGIAAGDQVGFTFIREGSNVNDTVNADCYYLGGRIRYV